MDAAELIGEVCDIALVLDEDGVIQEVIPGSTELAAFDLSCWAGQAMSATVTEETRGKVSAMLKSAKAGEPARWRQVNHPVAMIPSRAPNAPDIPVIYRITPFKRRPPEGEADAAPGDVYLALGRDQSAAADAQRRLIAAQHELESDYAQLRLLEARFRHVFHATPDAMLLVDAATNRIVEANRAAERLMSAKSTKLVGRSLVEGMDAPNTNVTLMMMAQAINALDQAGPLDHGDGDDFSVVALRRAEPWRFSASAFRHGGATQLLVRVKAAAVASADPVSGEPPRRSDAVGADAQKATRLITGPDAFAAAAIERSLDAFVVVDADGLIASANPAFVTLVGLVSLDQALSSPLDRFLGRTPVDCDLFLSAVSERGALAAQTTALRASDGGVETIEISAIRVERGGRPYSAFFFRRIRRAEPPSRSDAALPNSLEQLSELVGRVPLKTLVRETTDVIERLCVESALRLSGDNRAAAAEMLGLSRQSLYVKLRRFGLGDLDVEATSEQAPLSESQPKTASENTPATPTGSRSAPTSEDDG